MLLDVDINKKSLAIILKNIQKHSPCPEKVKIIAVTKTLSNKSIQSAENNKIFHIGESKIKETQQKLLKHKTNPKTKIHLIGHLQSNKVSQAIKLFHTIHSVDSIKLLNKINISAQKQKKKQKLFLQLNITKKETQKGFNKEEIFFASEQARQLSFIKVIGIMVIGPNTTNTKKIKESFHKTKKIQQKIQQKINKNCINLSMGMSKDYIYALQTGATHIRIGTKLFQKRNEK